LIPSLLVALALAQAKPDASLEKFRTPVEALTERAIGSASRSVRFDWRHSTVGFALIGSELLERNNFGSTRLGGLVRRPIGGFMGEVAITRAFTWGTDSSDKLSKTPYRQAGRPSRFELDVNLGLPLAEGVVTTWPSFLPPGEIVFSAHAGLRYLFYPGSVSGMKFLDATGALLSPQLGDKEIEALEDVRLPGMQIDRARYGLLGGFSLDVYFQPGAFFSPRVLVSIPILSPVNGSGLGFWYELTLGIGWTI
jgi:hypothetical protein